MRSSRVLHTLCLLGDVLEKTMLVHCCVGKILARGGRGACVVPPQTWHTNGKRRSKAAVRNGGRGTQVIKLVRKMDFTGL